MIDRYSRLSAAWRRVILLSPAFALIGAFGLAPLGLMLVYSFLVPGTYGGVIWEFSAEAYIQFLFERDIFDDTLAFNASYLQIGARSVVLAGLAVMGCLLIGYPTAYFIATRPPGIRNVLIFLVTVPFWTNLLVRTFSMMLILRDEGPLNAALRGIGITDRPLALLYTDFAIGIGLLYSFLPFMVLPIYASLERVDFRLVEAAYDLYANRWKVLRRILIPLSLPGNRRRQLPRLHPVALLISGARPARRRQAPDDRQPDRSAVRHLSQLAVRRGHGDGPSRLRADRADDLRPAGGAPGPAGGLRPWASARTEPTT